MKGSFHQSRRESNFYNYLKPDKQLAYAKQWVASLNSKLLEPFVKITGATKFNREVFYEIDIERLLKVEEENQRLHEALEFYADADNYEPVTIEKWIPQVGGSRKMIKSIIPQSEYVVEDGGEIARQALTGESNENQTISSCVSR